MGFLTKVLGIENLNFESPTTPLLPASALFESLGLGRSDAGVMVNERSAMRLSTAYGCIKIISEDLGCMPLSVYQSMPDGSVREAKEHRVYPLLHDAPNYCMTSSSFRGAMIASAAAYGNAFARISRDKANRVIGLWPLDSSKTALVFVRGKMQFATTQTHNGEAALLDPEDVLHFPGLSMDGMVGLSPITTCKNAFGLGIAAESFGARFFGNGSRASGVLAHPGHLDAEAYQNLKKSVGEWATGENALRPVILEEGMTWNQISIPNNDAQFLETRKFQRAEIAALFRVPLHLLQDLERSTNNNIEHQSLDYIRYCLKPWAVRFEQEINRKLLGGPFFAEHNMNDLQRGDFASQTTGYQTLRNIGVYSANDILRAMRQNPIPTEEGGDIRTVQMAFVSLETLLEPAHNLPGQGSDMETNSDQGDPAAAVTRRIMASFRPLWRDAVGRITNRQQRDQKVIGSAFRPILTSMAEAMAATRFGSPELTQREHELISAQLDRIQGECATWNKENAAETASRLLADACTGLELV